jgi:hypothetical protein
MSLKPLSAGVIFLFAIGCRLPLTTTKAQTIRNAHVLISEVESDQIQNSSDLKAERLVRLQYQGKECGAFLLHPWHILFSSPTRIKPIQIWEYQDYGGFNKITQSTDGRYVFVLTKHQLLLATFRVITIDLQSGEISSRKISREMFNDFSQQR